MRHARCVAWAAVALLLVGASADPAAAEKKRSYGIKIVEATYGGNCTGVAKGNVTRFVATACDNKDLCNYRVYYKQMGGDPAESCEKKTFAVSYTCGRNTRRSDCTLPAEAGKGGEDEQPNNFCLLHCLTSARPAVGAAKAAEGEAEDTAEAGQETRKRNVRVNRSERPVYRYHVERAPDGRPQVWGPYRTPW